MEVGKKVNAKSSLQITLLEGFQKMITPLLSKKLKVLIKELRLLARAVFVVDKDGVVKYAQIVDELTNEPDYEAVLKAVKEIMG